jgi:hypothetical protein
MDPLKKVSYSYKDTAVNFLKADMTEQRKTLEQKTSEVFYALAEVIERANHERQIMLLVVTTLDGILNGKVFD